MVQIRPFKALRPKKDLASQVVSPPYDVVTREEAKLIAENNPKSFLHVVRSEIDLDDNITPYDKRVYEKAYENLFKLIEHQVLIQDNTPSLYIYRLSSDSHSQTGIVCCSALSDYKAGVIKTHEKTREEKEKDRTTHILTLRAHTGPVLLVYEHLESINKLIASETIKEPTYDILRLDGTRHCLWRVLEFAPFIEEFKKIPCSYIADGHHRAASAYKVQNTLINSNPSHTGDEDYNFFLSVLFPDNELKILAYNRIIYSSEKSPGLIKAELNKSFEISENTTPIPKHKGIFSMYLEGIWYGLIPKIEAEKDSLDVSVLHNLVLEPVFGIRNERVDKNIDFVGGKDSTDRIKSLVDNKEAFAGFSLFPVSVNELITVTNKGLHMPPKSTWFEPKLLSGLVVNKF